MKKNLFALLFLPSILLAQGGLSTISGIITDKETGAAVTEAYIGLPTVGFGTGVNNLGAYTLRFPQISIDSEVVVSAMGYHSFRAKAADLLKDSVQNISMEKASLILTSLGISDVKVLVKIALDSVRANYPNVDFFQNGFYVETVSIQNVGLVKVNEALVRIERYPEDKEVPYRIKATRSRSFDWKGQSAKVEGWGFGNGAEVVMRSLETEVPEFLNKKNINNYDFRVDSLLTVYEGLELYSIRFSPKSERENGGRNGIIHLDPHSLAIVRISYELTPEGVKDVIKSGMSNTKITGTSVVASIQFGLSGNKWVLRDSRLTLRANFEERLDKKFKIDSEIKLRFVANESAILRRKSIRETEVLLGTNGFTASRSFRPDIWGNSNFLTPNPEMIEILKNLH